MTYAQCTVSGTEVTVIVMGYKVAKDETEVPLEKQAVDYPDNSDTTKE